MWVLDIPRPTSWAYFYILFFVAEKWRISSSLCLNKGWNVTSTNTVTVMITSVTFCSLEVLLNKLWYIQTLDYYSVLTGNELSSHEKTWRKLKCILINEWSQSERFHTIWNYNFTIFDYQIRSDQISCSIVSTSLRPYESQHARPPCPSPTPGVHWEHRFSLSATTEPGTG